MRRAALLIFCFGIVFAFACQTSGKAAEIYNSPGTQGEIQPPLLGVSSEVPTSDFFSTESQPIFPSDTTPPSSTATMRLFPSPSTAIATGPSLGGCQMFPTDNAWNQDISAAPVHPLSSRYIQTIGENINLHADFGSNPEYGIPFVVVPPGQPRVPIEFVEYGDESDPGPYPVPPDAPVEFGSDHHVLVLASGECKLYELYHAQRNGKAWQAGSGAVFDLSSNALRPEGWTSADAAGLPMLPGLVRFDEVQSGAIRHALRFTVENTGPAYIHPATHIASDSGDLKYPPMGLRVRLRADYDIAHFSGEARIILEALRRYGLIIADNGSNWFITGAKDSRWNDEDLDQLKSVPGSAFEAVFTGEMHT
jgi:hypothetical protein